MAEDFLRRRFDRSWSLVAGTCLQLISDLERKLQRRVVVVGSQLLSVLQHSSRVASLEDLQAQEAAAAQAAAVARESTPMAWAALSEEARRIARTVASLVQQVTRPRASASSVCHLHRLAHHLVTDPAGGR